LATKGDYFTTIRNVSETAASKSRPTTLAVSLLSKPGKLAAENSSSCSCIRARLWAIQRTRCSVSARNTINGSEGWPTVMTYAESLADASSEHAAKLEIRHQPEA